MYAIVSVNNQTLDGALRSFGRLVLCDTGEQAEQDLVDLIARDKRERYVVKPFEIREIPCQK